MFTTEESLPKATEASNGERSEQLSILLRQPDLVYLHPFIFERGTGGVIKSGCSLSHLTQSSLSESGIHGNVSLINTLKNRRSVPCMLLVFCVRLTVHVVLEAYFHSLDFNYIF